MAAGHKRFSVCLLHDVIKEMVGLKVRLGEATLEYANVGRELLSMLGSRPV